MSTDENEKCVVVMNFLENNAKVFFLNMDFTVLQIA